MGQQAGISTLFRCPEGSAAIRLHPLSFADCECLEGYTRDDTHKACTAAIFQCKGRYTLKAGLKTAKSIADCDCQHPYTKDNTTGRCQLRRCPRAGNYFRKKHRRDVTSLADCDCVDPYEKNDQSGECLFMDHYTCPPNSSPAANMRPHSFADCHCDWGFVRTVMNECKREQAAFVCPLNSFKRRDLPLGERPMSFKDCECLESKRYRRNEMTQSCDEVNVFEDGREYEQVDDAEQEPFECPPYSRPVAAFAHSVEQCQCLPGYGWKTPDMKCVHMSTYSCPPHSFKASELTHIETSFDDCDCARGFYRDESLEGCLEWFLTDNNGCPKHAFLKHWPLQNKANCQCIYGISMTKETDVEEAEAGHKSLRQRRREKKKRVVECNQPPTDNVLVPFSQCPLDSFATNWPLMDYEDCTCYHGYEMTNEDDEEMVCVPSSDDGVTPEEQAAACRAPLVLNPLSGECRLPVEEVTPTTKRHDEDVVSFKGIEYDYVLAEDNIMIIQGDIAIGELKMWKNADGGDEQFGHVLHGYYNSERDHRWKDATMCFQIDASAQMFDRLVRNAMNHVTEVTYFSFQRCKDNDCLHDHNCAHDYVTIKATSSSCFSYIGRIGGEQLLGVSADCGLGNVMHVLLHAIGLHHTIDRLDRDDHVRIAWECLPETKRSYFIVEDMNNSKNALEVPYDFFSIMHHPASAFMQFTELGVEQNGQNELSSPEWCQSIFPIIADPIERLKVLSKMGQRELLAVSDIHAVWQLYPSLQSHESPTYKSETQDNRAVVHESRLHTQDDVLMRAIHGNVADVDADGDVAFAFGRTVKGNKKHHNSVSKRAASFIGAVVTLFGFGAFVAFFVVELRKRALRGNDSFYTESLLNEKNLND